LKERIHKRCPKTENELCKPIEEKQHSGDDSVIVAFYGCDW